MREFPISCQSYFVWPRFFIAHEIIIATITDKGISLESKQSRFFRLIKLKLSKFIVFAFVVVNCLNDIDFYLQYLINRWFLSTSTWRQFHLKMNILSAKHIERSLTVQLTKRQFVISMKLITEQGIFASKLLEIQLRIAVSLNRHLLFQLTFKRHAILINTDDIKSWY